MTHAEIVPVKGRWKIVWTGEAGGPEESGQTYASAAQAAAMVQTCAPSGAVFVKLAVQINEDEREDG